MKKYFAITVIGLLLCTSHIFSQSSKSKVHQLLTRSDALIYSEEENCGEVDDHINAYVRVYFVRLIDVMKKETAVAIKIKLTNYKAAEMSVYLDKDEGRKLFSALNQIIDTANKWKDETHESADLIYSTANEDVIVGFNQSGTYQKITIGVGRIGAMGASFTRLSDLIQIKDHINTALALTK